MTSNPGNLERKVRQLDNDVQAIYEQLGSIQAHLKRHDNRFDSLETRFDTLEGRFDTLEGRFDSLEGRFATLESTVNSGFAQLTTLVESLRDARDR